MLNRKKQKIKLYKRNECSTHSGANEKKKREVVHRLNQLSQENKNTNNKFNVQMVG